MVKRFLASLLFFVTAGLLAAQDMPPLPPMNNDTTVSSSSNTSAPALPPLPDQQAAPASSASPALPPLPDQQAAPAAPASSASPALPPLPDQQAAPANSASPALPPLPDQQAAPAAASPAAPALPPVPGEAAPAAPAASTEPAASPEGAPVAKPMKKAAKQAWWTKTKKRANVIFGGWVTPKGGNESSRIAWTSQEVLNALLFKGYKISKPEAGKYDGQEGAGGNQWREFTFSVPKSKLTTQVYLKQVGKKVWLRVGPSEPPAFAEEGNTVAHVQKMREANLKALHLIQRKLGHRLSPHRIIRSWEAPYSYTQESVVE